MVTISEEGWQISIAKSLLERDIELKKYLSRKHQIQTQECNNTAHRLRTVQDRIDRQQQVLGVFE